VWEASSCLAVADLADTEGPEFSRVWVAGEFDGLVGAQFVEPEAIRRLVLNIMLIIGT
jgi:hypothetical protein